ncbi:EcoAI/FtnUII family type I restriction enzme subunit R [Nocardia sp. NPDC057440]|uniref:EcoAI/FtnUII family type I restriction enzme subunit R n=1 Tax=Nocardia sp. NPDC057440 TaxID=3346134 RepID=UPI0036711D18
MRDWGGIREDETCQRLVLPKLEQAGWQDEQIRKQYAITKGKIIASARRHRHARALVADYVLEYRDELPIAVVEAKRTRIKAEDGYAQATRYAEKLGLPVAYATNGHRIWEIVIGGPITEVAEFPSPEGLWQRFCRDTGVKNDLEKRLLTAAYNSTLRDSDNIRLRPRYYQRIAVDRALQAIARDNRKILLVLATGAGKTMVALQLVAKLRQSNWTPGRMPRVLYLADRNMLVDQPKDDYFIPAFGDVVHKLTRGRDQRSREIYFALYQSMEQGNEQALFEMYERDYFDLIIVDECHRGSARSASQWRRILEHFDGAIQIGLTATPINSNDAVTFDYFGNPVYEYSLRDGIEDGFLAPYRVRRVSLNVDVTGYEPEPGKLDTDGDPVPSGIYGPRQYERVLAILDRTSEVARYLTDYLRETDRMGKTIVFCENNDHAWRMTVALRNRNLDMVERYHNYVCRITDADGDPGLALLDEFRKVSTDEPVIAVTSQLLSTGIDLPSVKNIVIFRRIASTPLFKQMIGRGTRLCLEAGKGSFDIIDLTYATRIFNDPSFDGPPLRLVEDAVDLDGAVVERDEVIPDEDEEVAEPDHAYEQQDEGKIPDSPDHPAVPIDEDLADQIQANGKRIYVADVEVFVWNEAFYQLEPDGQTLRLVEYREFVRDQILSMRLSPNDLRTQWATTKSRTALLEELRAQAIEPEDLLARLGHPEADPIDLVIYAAWELPVVSRAERALRVRREQREFLESFGPTARKVLDALLEKFTEHGAQELSASALRVAPFSQIGNLRKISTMFGGKVELHDAIDHLGQYLFDVS